MQTLSQSERAFNQSFLGMFWAILKAIDLVSLVILGIMMLVVGNTIAMGVRERTQEYGALRALGFLPKHLVLFVLGEAVTIGLAGGLLGLALSYPIVERGMGRFLEENMGSSAASAPRPARRCSGLRWPLRSLSWSGSSPFHC